MTSTNNQVLNCLDKVFHTQSTRISGENNMFLHDEVLVTVITPNIKFL